MQSGTYMFELRDAPFGAGSQNNPEFDFLGDALGKNDVAGGHSTEIAAAQEHNADRFAAANEGAQLLCANLIWAVRLDMPPIGPPALVGTLSFLEFNNNCSPYEGVLTRVEVLDANGQTLSPVALLSSGSGGQVAVAAPPSGRYRFTALARLTTVPAQDCVAAGQVSATVTVP